MSAQYDLVLHGGTVIDPAQSLHAVLDVAFVGGKVAELGAKVAPERARRSVDVSGKIVAPGLVDLHLHCYYGVNSVSRDPRTELLPTGTTCAIDAGSAGSANVLAFREFIIEPAPLHIYAFLNVSPLGMVNGMYLDLDPYEMSEGRVNSATKAIARHEDKIVGVKLVLPGPGQAGYDNAEAAVKRTIEVAEAASTRAMIHIRGGLALEILCDHLRSGDIITHCYQGNDPSILDSSGEPRAAVMAAIDRGVVLDLAAAPAYNFDWAVAEASAALGLWPDTISTDWSNVPRSAPTGAMRSLPEVMAMMLHLGMPLDEVVRAATTTPAGAVGLKEQHGSLCSGRCGDAVVLEQGTGLIEVPDMGGRVYEVADALKPVLTVAHGDVAWEH